MVTTTGNVIFDLLRADVTPKAPHHVVTVGAGFGGLQAVRKLRGSGGRITTMLPPGPFLPPPAVRKYSR